MAAEARTSALISSKESRLTAHVDGAAGGVSTVAFDSPLKDARRGCSPALGAQVMTARERKKDRPGGGFDPGEGSASPRRGRISSERGRSPTGRPATEAQRRLKYGRHRLPPPPVCDGASACLIWRAHARPPPLCRPTPLCACVCVISRVQLNISLELCGTRTSKAAVRSSAPPSGWIQMKGSPPWRQVCSSCNRNLVLTQTTLSNVRLHPELQIL